jgi:hypothetical protein
MESMEPRDPEAQAAALLASRRILARMKLELVDRGAAGPDLFTDQDRELIRRDTERQLREDLEVFARWHESLGSDPEAALREMRRSLGDRPEG